MRTAWMASLVALMSLSCWNNTPSDHVIHPGEKTGSSRRGTPETRHQGPPSGGYEDMESLLGLLGKTDPELAPLVMKTISFANKPGALSVKTKALMALLADMLLGHDVGVRVMAKQARGLGATDEEIVETIRMAYLTAGLPGLVTGLNAFYDLAEQTQPQAPMMDVQSP